MKRKTDPQHHDEMPDSRPHARGLIRSTIWSIIKRARSSEEDVAVAARRELGTYYYNSLRRVFRSLTPEQAGRDDRAVDLTHAFLVEKVWSDESPLLRNVQKLN